MRIVEEKVKPDRAKLGGNRDAEIRKARWWLWGRYTPALFDAIRGLDRVLVICELANTAVSAFCPQAWFIPNNSLSSRMEPVHSSASSNPAPTKPGPDSSRRR